MCCNNSCRARCGSSCWGGCSNSWNLARTGSSCYVSVPPFLCPSAAAEEESGLGRGRFVVSGTIDQIRLFSGCGCGCGCD